MFDPLDELEEAIDKLAASEASLDVLRITKLTERLDCLRLRAVRAFDVSGAWIEHGSLSAAADLRHRARMTYGAAAESVRLGRRLEQFPELAGAFANGEVNRQHVRAMADAYTAERAGGMSDVETQLVEVARLTDAREFRSVLTTLTDALDGDGGAARAEAQHERRHLHLSEMLDGVFAINGVVDHEAGLFLRSTLDAAMEPLRTGDTRSTGQRRADALVDVCAVAAPALAGGPARGDGPHLACVTDVEVLERRGGSALADVVRTDAAAGGPLAAETLRRIACDARISRVITDGRSRVLDVGRTTRVVSRALWQALVVRDGGCVAPDCDRPPGFCDAHHKRHWIDGGTTDLDNLELRCRRHHRAVHEGARVAGTRRDRGG